VQTITTSDTAGGSRLTIVNAGAFESMAYQAGNEYVIEISPPPAAVVAATDAGRAVLDRRLDRVACGLDRWIGGVHLQPGGRIWRWDEAQGAVARG